uniref:Reverse transcriptase domain-containing protein n=1 Tax=Tanacetum cinerariifolium TaxID=118510 RepID=A0A6L2MDX0_TANCI|nr:reverse transcriptase domain-containing protein [Tanacetum cinerariifolium]
MRNNDLQTKLEYFSEDYDEEQEMEPRPEPTRAATPPLRVTSPRIQAPIGNEGQSVNLPQLLAAHLGRGKNGKPLQSSLTFAYGGQALPNNIGGSLPSNEYYPLPDGLKMPSHIGSYDRKGDPDNFLHLFEGAIRMKKWLMPIACQMFTYTLKDSARIWWNSQKASSILDYEDLKNYTWVKARDVATNGASSDRRDSFERSKKSSWDNNRGQKNKDRFSPYRGPNYGLLLSLSKSSKEILAIEKAARSFEPPPKMFGSKRSQDMSKYCHFHEDYEHDTNDYGHLRTHIQEVVNSSQLLHLVKGIKKERTSSFDTSRGERKKDKATAPAEAPTLMVSQEAHITKSLAQENTDYEGKKIIFPQVAKVNNAPVIIETKIFRRKVGRVYMDVGSACEIIYEHCFEKLNPTIKATKVDLKTPLVGFSGERSWSIGKTGEGTKRARKIFATNEERILSCINAEEKIIVNDKATNQRLVDKVFSHQIGRNLEAYVDDMVIKSTYEKEIWKDIQETFKRFRSINMKLNPKKCTFGIEEGPFLGHLITKQGIKANTLKVKEVTDLDQPRTLKDIQSLNENLIALSQFLSKVAERSLAFFKVLIGCKDKKSIMWTTEADKALKKMKKIVQTIPTLTAPRGPISCRTQLSYLGKACTGLGSRSKKTPKILQAYTITVLTNTPIKQMLMRPEKTRRVAKWATELGEHDIVFLRRDEKETPADFLVEIPLEENDKKEKPKEVPDLSSKWRLYTDGASNLDESGAGLMLIDPEGKEYTYALRFEFEITNNEAEYEALLGGLQIAQEMEIVKVGMEDVLGGPVFIGHESDRDDNQVNDSFKKGEGYDVVPHPYTGNYMPPIADLFFVGLDNYVFKSKVSETITSVPKIETNASKSNSEVENVFKPKEVKKTVKPSLEKIEFVNARNTTVENENKAEKPRKFSQGPRGNKRNWNGLMTQKLKAYTYYCQLKVSAAKSKFTTTGDAKPTECEGFEQIIDFLNASYVKYALTVNPTIYTSCIEQFRVTAKVNNVNGEAHIQALLDKKKVIITEASIRRDLMFEDEGGIDSLSNEVIFEQLTLIGAKTTAWNEFSSTMASAIICLATN